MEGSEKAMCEKCKIKVWKHLSKDFTGGKVSQETQLYKWVLNQTKINEKGRNSIK